jgi:hypothetical protein
LLRLTRDYLADGYISYTFTSRNAEFYVVHLFRRDAASVKAMRDRNGAYSVFIPPSHFSPPIRTQYGDTWVLDHAVRTGGSVVPQQLWAPPQGQGDRRRYVDQAQFRMPIFFVNMNGGLGVPVMNAAAGHMQLRDAYLPSSLIDKTTTKIRIGVCAWVSLNYVFPITYHISQWPGYAPSEHQVQLKDQTPAKNPIGFGRFVKHVGSRVRQFLMVRLSWMWRRISEIKTGFRIASALLANSRSIGWWDMAISPSMK